MESKTKPALGLSFFFSLSLLFSIKVNEEGLNHVLIIVPFCRGGRDHVCM